MVFFMDNAVSIDVQRDKGREQRLDLSRSLASTHFQAMDERRGGGEP